MRRPQVYGPLRKPCAKPSHPSGTSDACPKSVTSPPSTKPPIEAWTIPFHVVMWTVLLCGLIMVMVVVMLNP